MPTFISWNVNGIRAVHRKRAFFPCLEATDPDILCLQEVRADVVQLPAPIRAMTDYHAIWNPSRARKGYSGTAILSKTAPLAVELGLGVEEFDREGRTIIAEYPAFYLLNCYFPSGASREERLQFKQRFNEAFLQKCEALRAHKPVIFGGDVNIAHTPLDLAEPERNQHRSGFLPEERAWLDRVVAAGFRDAFRQLHPDQGEVYSWWPMRQEARAQNLGWRLDYFFIDAAFTPHLREAAVLTEVQGSDHAPVMMRLDVS